MSAHGGALVCARGGAGAEAVAQVKRSRSPEGFAHAAIAFARAPTSRCDDLWKHHTMSCACTHLHARQLQPQPPAHAARIRHTATIARVALRLGLRSCHSDTSARKVVAEEL